MSRYFENDSYSQTGDWLLGTARRNPEALLLLAAGCCLLMRSGGSWTGSASRSHIRQDDWAGQRGSSGGSSTFSEASAQMRQASSDMRDRASRAAGSAAEYASQMKDRVTDSASSYAQSVADFADDARRRVSESSARLGRQAQSTFQSTTTRVLREQPLAVAAAGLAVGAAIAAIFPSTELEERTLGGAGASLRDAAGEAGERVKDAAVKAGERLMEAAEERGLTTEGLKDLAGDVAETFKSEISGKSGEHDEATVVPKAPASPGPGQIASAGQGMASGQSAGARQGGGAGQSAGTRQGVSGQGVSGQGAGSGQGVSGGQSGWDSNRQSGFANTDTGPGRSGR